MRFGSMLAGLAAAVALATPAMSAQSDYPFTLYNNSTQYPITGFQTYENGRWVTWEFQGLAPGHSVVMNWPTNDGECSIQFRIFYSNYEPTTMTMDFCRYHSLIVTDSDVTWR